MRDALWGVGLAALALCASAALAQPIKVGQAFPNFSEPDVITGQTVSLEGLRGKVVLLDFWATWCGPCRAKLPELKKLNEKYGPQGLEIVGISLDKDIEAVRAFSKSEGLKWKHIADGKFWKAKLAVRHGINSIPHVVVIGRDGKVVADNPHGRQLEKAIQDALGKQADVPVDDEHETDARKMLSQADKARDGGDVEGALKLYDEIVIKYAGRPTAKTAAERARDVREDPDFEKKLKGSKKQEAPADPELGKKAAQWLKVARQMSETKNYGAARRYYERILAQAPKTPEAEIARKELEALPK